MDIKRNKDLLEQLKEGQRIDWRLSEFLNNLLNEIVKLGQQIETQIDINTIQNKAIEELKKEVAKLKSSETRTIKTRTLYR